MKVLTNPPDTLPLSQLLSTLPEFMDETNSTKEKVREYLKRRQAERRQGNFTPPHDPQQIRQEVGWDMVERRRQDRRQSCD
jgi:hypothetical protein